MPGSCEPWPVKTVDGDTLDGLRGAFDDLLAELVDGFDFDGEVTVAHANMADVDRQLIAEQYHADEAHVVFVIRVSFESFMKRMQNLRVDALGSNPERTTVSAEQQVATLDPMSSAIVPESGVELEKYGLTWIGMKPPGIEYDSFVAGVVDVVEAWQ
jgi:hypothetical protein